MQVLETFCSELECVLFFGVTLVKTENISPLTRHSHSLVIRYLYVLLSSEKQMQNIKMEALQPHDTTL